MMPAYSSGSITTRAARGSRSAGIAGSGAGLDQLVQLVQVDHGELRANAVHGQQSIVAPAADGARADIGVRAGGLERRETLGLPPGASGGGHADASRVSYLWRQWPPRIDPVCGEAMRPGPVWSIATRRRVATRAGRDRRPRCLDDLDSCGTCVARNRAGLRDHASDLRVYWLPR